MTAAAKETLPTLGCREAPVSVSIKATDGGQERSEHKG